MNVYLNNSRHLIIDNRTQNVQAGLKRHYMVPAFKAKGAEA